MKKVAKLICLLMILVLSISMFTGCIVSTDGGGEEEVLDLTVAVPASARDNWSAWEPVLTRWYQEAAEIYKFNLTIVTIPTTDKEMKDFMKKVKSGEIALFFSEDAPFIDQLIEQDALIDITSIQQSYNGFKKEVSPAVWDVSVSSDKLNYMVPYYGSYQGLYINTEVFEANGIDPITDWNSMLTAIEKLKAAGITPIAAGFKDRGLEYMIDELVLCEGGAAEHSFVPKNGILSSWERAIADIKDLEAKGAFTEDCYNVTFEEAKQDFIYGNAAMIVAPSSDIVSADNKDSVAAVAFPTTPNGKREQGDFIGDITVGAYVSAKYFNQVNERYAKMVIELLGTDYGSAADFVSLIVGTDGFSVNKSYYNVVDGSELGESYSDLLDMAYGGDRPMRTYIKTMDKTVGAFRKVLQGADVTSSLQAAVDAEVAARAEAK